MNEGVGENRKYSWSSVGCLVIYYVAWSKITIALILTPIVVSDLFVFNEVIFIESETQQIFIIAYSFIHTCSGFLII